MLLALFWIAGAQAVHDDGFFELDRNAASEAAPGEDWDAVFANTDTATASTFDHDATGASIFTGGGSKDDLDTTQWKHKSGSVPDKDEILDAYAARYGANLYFGADRFDNSGDSQMGFWFFQNSVTAQPGGTFGPAAHKNGDVLVLSDFSGGGANVTVRVFQWHSPGGSINGTLDLIGGSLTQTADCVGPPSVPNGDNFCGTINRIATPSPWPFAPKNQPANIFQAGEFYEGGIDLSFLNLQNECFASFLAETRSSTSVNATLKDFVGGTFQPCTSSLTTTPSDANGDPATSIQLGDDARDYALVQGTGSNQNPTGTVAFTICAPDELDDPGTINGQPDNPNTCDIGGTLVSTNAVTPIANTSNSEALSDAFTPDAVGTWCWRGHYSGDARYPAADDATGGECFQVTDIASTTTAQSWLPQDTATITSAGGSAIAGTVTFQLYETANCSGTVVQTFSNRPVTFDAATGYTASTNNTTYYTTTKTISWRATFTSSNSVASGPAGHCETMTVSTLNNDTGS